MPLCSALRAGVRHVARCARDNFCCRGVRSCCASSSSCADTRVPGPPTRDARTRGARDNLRCRSQRALCYVTRAPPRYARDNFPCRLSGAARTALGLAPAPLGLAARLAPRSAVYVRPSVLAVIREGGGFRPERRRLKGCAPVRRACLPASLEDALCRSSPGRRAREPGREFSLPPCPTPWARLGRVGMSRASSQGLEIEPQGLGPRHPV